MSLKYRPDIDGLRAIAVLAVIFFHANIPGFSGGYVGVDIFFVISGFLITSIILKDIESGNFSIWRFYERRIRRIFPPLFLVIIFSLVTGGFVFDTKTFQDLGASITAATLFISNIYFWHDTGGYFAAPSIQKPLLHTWSLAVEEQFYILFPLLIIWIKRSFNKKYTPILLGITFISFVISIYGVYTHQPATFYLVPTRAWELLAGSILALNVLPPLKSDYQRNIFSLLGLVLIFISVKLYTETTLFPAYNAVAPVLGATLIIYSGINGISSVSKIISLRPLVYTGLISYSLYLWHWPLLVFFKYIIFRDFTIYDAILIIFITFAVSSFSLIFMEMPFRKNKTKPKDRHRFFILTAIVVSVTSVFGGVIYFEEGMPYLYPEASRSIKRLEDEVKCDWGIKYDTLKKNGNVQHPIIGPLNKKPSFVLWGDSHAMALIPALTNNANQYGVSGFITTASGTPPLIGVDPNTKGPEFTAHVLSFIKLHPEIKTIIIAAYWSMYASNRQTHLLDSTNTYIGSRAESSLALTVKTLLNMGKNVVLVSDVPQIKNSPEKIVWFAERFGVNYIEKEAYVNYKTKNRAILNILQKISKINNVKIIYPESMLFDREGYLRITLDNKYLYGDNNHLSRYGSEYIAPVFSGVFKNIATTDSF